MQKEHLEPASIVHRPSSIVHRRPSSIVHRGETPSMGEGHPFFSYYITYTPMNPE